MTEKHYPRGEPTIGHRASIADWTLSVTFLSKEQCKLFMNDLMDLPYNINIEFDCEEGDSLTRTLYTVTFQCSWANNLTMIGEMLEKYDYNSGDCDD